MVQRPEREPVCDQIKIKRHFLGYSLKKLAEIVHSTPGTISKIENGHLLPFRKDFIRDLASALGIDQEELLSSVAFERRKASSWDKDYPNTHSLIKLVIRVMDNNERNLTFEFFERRILLFKEDEVELAVNFANYLLGHVKLSDLPENGLRPLSHYFLPWSSEIELWQSKKTYNYHQDYCD